MDLLDEHIAEPLAGLLRTRRCWLGTAALIVLAGAVPEFLNPVYGDTAWFLLTAGRLLDGSRLYTDLIEPNPPLISWLATIPVWLARVLGLSSVTVFRVGMVALLLASTTVCHRLLARLWPGAVATRRAVVLLVLIVLFPLARGDFGQREHIILALVLPYVIGVACRAAGKPVASRPAAVLGALTGVGMAIKPFFGLVWAALLGWEWLTSRSRRAFWTPEALGAGTVLFLYPVAVAVVTPGYFEFVRHFGPAYAQWAAQGPAVVAYGDGSWLAIGGLAAYLLLRPSMPAPGLWDRIAVTTVAAFACAVLQQKGWRYHFYPALSLGLMLLGGVTLLAAGHRPVSRIRHATAILARAGVFTMLTTTAAVALRATAEGFDWTRTGTGRLIIWAKSQGEQRLLMLDEGWLEAAVAFHAGLVPSSRVASLFPIHAGHTLSQGNASPRYRSRSEVGYAERTVLRMSVEDFVRADPVLLFLAKPGEIDVLEYLSRDSAFAAAFWQYTFVGTIEGRPAFRRLSPGETRVERPHELAESESNWVSRALGHRKRRGTVFFGFLLLLIYGEYRKRDEPRRRDVK